LSLVVLSPASSQQGGLLLALNPDSIPDSKGWGWGWQGWRALAPSHSSLVPGTGTAVRGTRTTLLSALSALCSLLSALSASCSCSCQLPAASSTTSQLVRSVFQSIMDACEYEGAFSAEPAAGDHPWGDWGDPWRRWLGPRPTRSCQTWLCSGK
jgi:hypothetical protein